MSRLLPLAAVLCLTASRAISADPTVIIDIHARGHSAVAELKQEPTVLWSAEMGNELLLGVEAQSLSTWLERSGTRAGPERLAFDEVVVRDHVCTVEEPEPALAVVGGYEILRKPPSLVRATRGALVPGEPLPIGGVIAREQRNELQPRQALAIDPAVARIVARVDGDRWFDTMSALAGFNRNSFSPALGQARQWILGQFAASGLQTHSFQFNLSVTTGVCNPAPPAATLFNPIGIKTGLRTPDEWIVVGAHYDSRNASRCDGTIEPQPGANDNGSGCAAVIELARVFADIETDRTLLFMCFAGEEQGLIGSRRYVESLQANGNIAKVKHMINLDMLGHAVDDALSARVETIVDQQSLLPLYASAAATYAPELNLITSASTQAYSDHWYFLAAGVPGVFTWENGAGIYPHYHQLTDIPANMERARPLAAGVMKMDVAMLVGLAGASTLLRDGFED